MPAKKQKLIPYFIITILITLIMVSAYIGKAAFIEPLVGPGLSNQDFAQNILGANNANNDFDSTSVGSNTDGSIIERLEFISNNLFWTGSGSDIYRASGNTGIATSSPWGYLSVEGQGTIPALVVSDTSNNTDFIVNASGNVGVATTSPGALFSVAGSALVQSNLAVEGAITSGLVNGQTISSAASFTGTVNAVTGYKVNGVATSGNVLRGNGTNFVDATLAGSDITGAALTKVDDSNVTLTLGANAATSLLRATSLTLGWNGQLAVDRGGTGTNSLTGLLQGNGTSAITAVTGTAGQIPYFNGASTLLATSTVFVATSGNVGVGTSGPSYKLDVNGIVNASAFYISGVPSVNSQWTTSGSNIYYNTGNVGIGTTTPTAKLNVVSGQTYEGMSLLSGNASSYTAMNIGRTAAESYWAVADAADVGTPGTVAGDILISTSAGKLFFAPVGGTVFNTGNVGIGTTAPGAKLQINSPDDSVSPALSIRQDNAPTYGWDFYEDTLVNGDFYLKRVLGGVSTDVMAFARATGNVGIGTTTPGALFSVEGAGLFKTSVKASFFTGTDTTATSTLGRGVRFGGGGYVYDNGTQLILGHD